MPSLYLAGAGAPAPSGGARAYGLADLRPAGHAGGYCSARGLMGLRICARHARGAPAPAAPVSCMEVRRA